MTNEELAVVIPLEVDLEFADRIERELLRDHPPYTGTKDHNPTTEENAAYIIRRLARRLREQGEPLEMYLCEASAVVLKPQTYRFVVDPDCESCKEAEIDALIIHPQEPKP